MVSKLFHFLHGFGFGIEKIWYQKKYQIRYRKNLVSKKFGIEKSFGFGIGKSFGFGFIHILDILGVVSVSKLLRFSIKKFVFGFGKSLVSEKVSDSVSFRSGVSSRTGLKMIELAMLIYYGGITMMMMIYLRRLSLLGGMSGVEQVGRQSKHLIGGNSQFLMKIMMTMMRL